MPPRSSPAPTPAPTVASEPPLEASNDPNASVVVPPLSRIAAAPGLTVTAPSVCEVMAAVFPFRYSAPPLKLSAVPELIRFVATAMLAKSRTSEPPFSASPPTVLVVPPLSVHVPVPCLTSNPAPRFKVPEIRLAPAPVPSRVRLKLFDVTLLSIRKKLAELLMKDCAVPTVMLTAAAPELPIVTVPALTPSAIPPPPRVRLLAEAKPLVPPRNVLVPAPMKFIPKTEVLEST